MGKGRVWWWHYLGRGKFLVGSIHLDGVRPMTIINPMQPFCGLPAETRPTGVQF